MTELKFHGQKFLFFLMIFLLLYCYTSSTHSLPLDVQGTSITNAFTKFMNFPKCTSLQCNHIYDSEQHRKTSRRDSKNRSDSKEYNDNEMNAGTWFLML